MYGIGYDADGPEYRTEIEVVCPMCGCIWVTYQTAQNGAFTGPDNDICDDCMCGIADDAVDALKEEMAYETHMGYHEHPNPEDWREEL